MPMLNMLERGQQANTRKGTAEAGKGEAAKSGFFLRLVVLLFFTFGYMCTIKVMVSTFIKFAEIDKFVN